MSSEKVSDWYLSERKPGPMGRCVARKISLLTQLSVCHVSLTTFEQSHTLRATKPPHLKMTHVILCLLEKNTTRMQHGPAAVL